ncbi:MAG: hypothetical protein ACMUJM_03990 [bacterium]
MKIPNKYLSIILIMAIFYVLYEYAMPSRKAKEASSAKRAPDALHVSKKEISIKDEILKSETIKSQKSAGHDTTSLMKKERKKILTWERDPFILPDPLHPVKKVEDEPLAAEQLSVLPIKVSSILISGNEKVATIDRDPYIVSIGDWIENEKVVGILSDKIIVEKNGARRELLLNPY